MATLVVLSGVPASGKSHFAKSLRKKAGKHVYIVSSDETRKIVLGSPQNFTAEKLCWKMFYSLARVYSMDEKGIVVLDATQTTAFFRTKATASLKPLFKETVLVSFNIRRSVLMKQNLEREWPVPIEVMDKMIEEFEKPNEEDEAYFDKIYTIDSHDIDTTIGGILDNYLKD